MIEILTATAVFGFSLGFSQEMAKDLRRMLRRHRRPSCMGPPKGSYGSRLDEGLVQRGNGSSCPTTPKPRIIPKPQFPSPREIPGDTP